MRKRHWQDKLKRLGTDIFVLVSLSSLFTGGLLNLSGLKRPEVYQTINSVLIPLGTLALLTSIGLAMRIKTIQDYLKECVVISGIKFLIVPVILTLTAFLLGYGKIEHGLPLKVVMILSSMPVAFTALVPPSLYDLDIDLANSCWLFTHLHADRGLAGFIYRRPVLFSPFFPAPPTASSKSAVGYRRLGLHTQIIIIT